MLSRLHLILVYLLVFGCNLALAIGAETSSIAAFLARAVAGDVQGCWVVLLLRVSDAGDTFSAEVGNTQPAQPAVQFFFGGLCPQRIAPKAECKPSLRLRK